MMKTEKIKSILQEYGQAIGIGVIFLLTYFPALHWMWQRWFAKDSYYSHGILVPAVTAFLIWQRREEIKKYARIPSPWGIRLIVAGLLVHVLSSLLRVYFSSAFSMMIVLFGIVLHFFGVQMLRAIVFPLCFLVFMIPMPLVVVVNASFKMKLVAADISAKILNQMGLLAVRSGSIIRMRSAYVIVDDVCSGLRSLISLAALGSLFAYWLKGPVAKKLLLFAMTIPIAIVTNVCRVVILAAVSEIWGPEYSVGFIHDATGFMVFALAFCMLYGTTRLIE